MFDDAGTQSNFRKLTSSSKKQIILWSGIKEVSNTYTFNKINHVSDSRSNEQIISDVIKEDQCLLPCAQRHK